MRLATALGLDDAPVISLVGAGGKTSLMLALASEFVTAGERVLVTTTTKMARDEVAGRWPAVRAAGAREVLAQAGPHLSAARPGAGAAVIAFRGEAQGGSRVRGFSPETVDDLAGAPVFDRILVEADGSARRTLKAPAAHEPVIPACTGAVVVVAGLDGVGRALGDDVVFRAGRWADLTGLSPGEPISPESLARMAAHDDGWGRGVPGGARRVLFLNRADSAERETLGKRVMAAVADLPGRPGRVVLGRLRPTPHIVELLVPA